MGFSDRSSVMFEEIVVGVNEGEGGLDAIALARALAAPGARLILAHMIVGGPSVGVSSAAAYASDSSPQSIEESERKRAIEILDAGIDDAGLERTGLGLELRCLIATSVGRGLHALAQAKRADLIALGSSRRSGLDRVLVGDDTHAGLHRAPAPVAVAPRGYARRARKIRTVGVGYNRSSESEHAVHVARALAQQLGAKLSGFTAVAVPTASFGSGPLALSEAIDALLRNARERIVALGGMEPHAAYGAAAEELTAFSGSVDLLVVGSRGQGPIGRLVHGSTSTHLARTARCPLIVLTRAGVPTERQASGHRFPARATGAST